jgi:hypothetical protein
MKSAVHAASHAITNLIGGSMVRVDHPSHEGVVEGVGRRGCA